MTRSTRIGLGAGLLAPLLSVVCLAACSSSQGGPPGASSPPATTATPASATGPAYDGPEAGLPTSYSISKPTKPFTIGYEEIYGADPSVKAGAEAAQQEVAALGGKIIIKDDQASATTQVNNCNTLIAQGVNAIILYPFDPKALGPCFAAAAAKNIKIVAYQTPVGASPGPLPAGLKTDPLQGFDYAGYLRAKAVAAVAPGSTFAYMGLAIPVASLTYGEQRMLYWAKRFGLKYVGSTDAQDATPGAASTAMSSILAKWPTVGTVFCFQDPSALAAATVARASGNTKVRIVGYNGQTAAVSAVQAGTMFATVLLDVKAEGKNDVDAAIGLIEGASLPKYVSIPITLVTGANAGSVTGTG